MRRFVAVRFVHAIVVLLVVTTIAFFLIHLAPGDPFAFDDPRITDELRARWRGQFGYDRPLIEQYGRYMWSVAQGKLGYSHSQRVPVIDAIAVTVPRTLLLMGLSLVLSFAIGVWLGIFEVRRSGRGAARVTNALTLLIYSLPAFWLALMVLLLFAYWVPVFPSGGMIDVVLHDYMSPSARLWDRVRHLVLPLSTLVLLGSAVIARYQRSALLESMPSDWIRTARAKGVDEASIVSRHALRNALLPMITLAGLSFPALLGGAVFVERVFGWPGMGLLVTNAIGARDYPLVTASILVGAVMVVAGNFLADVAYGMADPRIRVR